MKLLVRPNVVTAGIAGQSGHAAEDPIEARWPDLPDRFLCKDDANRELRTNR